MPTLKWLTENFYLPQEGAALPGPYNPDYVPYLWGVFHALDDPGIRTIALMKAAQIGWTFAIIGYIGRRIHTEPSPMLILFPKEGTGREFADEKFTPSIRDTPALAKLMDVSGSRKTGQRTMFRSFPGGFIKMVGSNSIGSVKSTPASLVVVEEPDDANEDIKGQGGAITLAQERLKRFTNSKLILGGTPSIKGVSRIEEILDTSDKRVLPIRCHDCGGSHVLDWANVSWLDRDDKIEHPVYGAALPETAIYACPYCGTVWDDWRRKENILETVRSAFEAGDPFCGWESTGQNTGGVVGFTRLSELYVCIPGTSLADVVRDYLEADYNQRVKGDENAMKVFVNSKLGEPYEYKDEQAGADELRAKALDYKEKIVPRGGFLLTAGIDVQHNRVAVVVRAWGRNEESWLVYWGEFFADHTCVDRNDLVWAELDGLVFGDFTHEMGAAISISAISIDSSDGNTNDSVYHWVRSRGSRHRDVQIMAIKGSSEQQDPEIFATPKVRSIDHRRPDRQTKADKWGVKVYVVGTNRAKDWLAGRMNLEVSGRGSWHYYKDVRADYFDQITAEVKAPHKKVQNRRIWQLKSGRRNEALDCETYALHGARAIRVHLMRPAQWDALEQRLTQQELFPVEKPTNGAIVVSDKKKPSRADIARRLNG
uniref:Phage terminase, large subunit GpA n=1 Tax=Candidatus Kentrum sp. LFY TaxID=2126342 RepID=A0A450WC01_9GAMM|nr:MAG: Phage terminase, large subunit GpA [Candidatus Kentron sp. LFY]